MIKVLFFAQVRELVGEDGLELAEDYGSVNALRLALAGRGDKWALALSDDRLLAAVNHNIVPLDTAIKAGDEVAFFPPVTGG
ncbi:molybdopterin synthase sulfur carrier subunit [Zobellella taiwanensis]|jgi:molybdopterin synthase sulfur carrier subunit|uniref:Molybdopterin synthase sulfur carrier subunit n=1 Tax=Zobellella taiwanensis TaxID=347535 RepID=A0A2P7QHU0_9GAMM|nr:molybdopterin synthase sulfur carrier subunit [Zobellella taiwanensis]PSJ37519.1 molybdopterin synthase sulfur carrier subunit [Zobellella taiwanensis]